MMNSSKPQANLHQIWEGFHWLFFVNVQGLIVCLQRFENQLVAGNLNGSKIELETATKLLLASGAAMELAGSFSRNEYEEYIRPTMMPPQVQSDNFSGLMSWDHALLIKIWKRLSPVFKTLPNELHSQHKQFIEAYLTLAHAHTAVCDHFGGDENGSLRCSKSSAVKRLKDFEKSRLKIIAANNHSDTSNYLVK